MYLFCRILLDGLLKGVHNVIQLKDLLKVFHLDRNFHGVAESMIAVYCVLKHEETVIKTVKFDDLLSCLKQKSFFTTGEEEALSNKEKKIGVCDILEILKDKDLTSFKTFLTCIKELNQEWVITCDENLTSYNLYHNFRCSLQKQYSNLSFLETSDIDFRLPISDDINIALIEVSEEDHKKNSTFFDYHSLLLKQEASYTRKFLNSYSDIVVENCRVVLIQGYPGSGKTCLAKQLCTKWAKGELLQTFSCVIFLQLRDEEIANANLMKTIIELHMGPLSESTVEDIYESHGKGLLIILEGWDELPESRQHGSLFTRLISGVLLPEAVILITSRPSAVRSLQFKHIQRRIEILGFTEQQVAQNIAHYFQEYKNDPELVEKFKSDLNRLPLLKSFVFVPINLSISLYIFNANSYKLPETFTSMYIQLVLVQLQRYQTRTSYGTSSISNFENLPPEINDMLLGLSKMAYDNMVNNITLTFTEAKIKQYCFDSIDKNFNSFDGMGLLQVTNHRHYASISKTYEFIHRTLQELLAAWYLSRQDKSFQQKCLRSIFNKKEFEMIWIFYAGLTKFTSVSFREYLPDNYLIRIKMTTCRIFNWMMRPIARNLFIKFPDLRKVTENFHFGYQYSSSLSNCISREFQTTLIAAVMEAQNPQLCKEMCESYLFDDQFCTFCVPASAATPQVLTALSYCIAHSRKKWMVHCKPFDKNGADYLLKYLTCSKSDNCECNKCESFSGCTNSAISIFDVDCSQYPINGIPRLLRTQKDLQFLIMSYSKEADDKLITEVAEALEDNTSLTMLHLVGCNITSNGLKAIAHMLKKNKTLKWIGLKDNTTTLNEEDIIMLLQQIHYHNDSIFLVYLDSMFHSSHKVQDYLMMINNKRKLEGKQTLYLSFLGAFNHHDFCKGIISRIPFTSKEEVRP